MALEDLYSNANLFSRWLHVMAGITWIGILYFFNFINVPLQGALDDGGKKAVNPKMMPRALWWFRWGAMVTFVMGMVLFTLNYMYAPGAGFSPTQNFMVDGALTGRAVWILMGMTFGTIMWFNVWFIIWPAQKKLLSEKAGDQAASLRKTAGLASRVNTYLSGPMLFGMLAPAHYGAVNSTTLAVALMIGFGAIYVAILHSFKVGKSV